MQLTHPKTVLFLITIFCVGISHNLKAMEKGELSALDKINWLRDLAEVGSDIQKKEATAIWQKIEARLYEAVLKDFNCTSHDELRNAARAGNEEKVEILLKLGANPNGLLENATPLMKATKKGHSGVVEKLLQHKDIDVDKQKMNGQAALHIAARENKFSIAKMLLAAGATKNLRMYVWDKEGVSFTCTGPTAYLIAKIRGFTELAELLEPNTED